MSNRNKTKILAMYLPQFHQILENDRFWGKGFTDWVAVKSAKSLYEGHMQPIEPLCDNYYDLSKKDTIRWQIELAKRYGVYGFGIYHYWFSSSKVLLTKPAEIILANRDLDIPFFFAWDNANWRRSWSRFRGNSWAPLEDKKYLNTRESCSILVEYKLGEEPEWKKHFEYLLPYFTDDRYIKIEGKPIFIVFNYSEKISNMEMYWNDLAKAQGFAGIHFIYKKSQLYRLPERLNNYCYEPQYTGWGSAYKQYLYKALSILRMTGFRPHIYSYDQIWKGIIRNALHRSASQDWHCAFVTYDDTPRRGRMGRVVSGSSPQKFQEYLTDLINICQSQGKEYILLTAWNEWGEGAVLEPSKTSGYMYLEALQRALGD